MRPPSDEEQADFLRQVEEFKAKQAAVPPEERRRRRPTSINAIAERLLGPSPVGTPPVDLDALDDVPPSRRAVLDRAAALSSALSAMPPSVGLVHRGVYATPAQVDSYRPGTTITELGFTSTTRAVENSFGGDVDLLIASRTGKAVREHSARPDEDEVVFDHGTSFDVLATGTDGPTGRRVVVLREAAPADAAAREQWLRAATRDAVVRRAATFLEARAQVPAEQRRALDYAKFTPALGADPDGVIATRPTRA